MNKLKFLSWFALTVFSATAMWATIPMGSVDGVTGSNGSFHVWGWALDPDQPSTAIAVHVYIYPQGDSNPVKGYNAAVANLNRPDLKSDDPNSIGALYGTVHGFDCWIDITSEVPAGTYDVRVWPINVGSSEGNHTITYSGNGGDVKTITISNPYTVSYNANGGSGAPGSQRKVTGINITLSSTTPTRTGYAFNGWNTASNGSGTNYAKGATYSANASATLYAKWTANKYTVTLNQQSGSGGSSSVQATCGSAMPSATMPTRTGYTFNGYFDATSGGTKYYNANGSSAKNWDKTAAATLYAQWNLVNYTITYNLNGGNVSTANPASYNVTTNTFTLNNPTRAGYTFVGWTGSNGETPQTTVQIAKGSTENKTYTANWEVIYYPIAFDYAGGSALNEESYSIESNTFTLNNPTKDGYTFAGWTGSNGNTPQMTVQIAKGSTGDKNYVAHWAINPNTNVVYLDSLNTVAAQETVAFNRPEAPEVAGFTFVRWEVVEGPLSEGIKLQAIYAENKPSGAPKKQVGKFTLTRKGDKNEYILQTAK